MGERVLVVDDDREIVKAIDILLRKEGYEVLKAYDGLQALDILAREHAHPAESEHPRHRAQCKERGDRQGAGTVHGGR